MDGRPIDPRVLSHLREQKEAEIVERVREHGGLLQALHQNQTRRVFLEGQLSLLDDLLLIAKASADTPPATEA